jgi:TatD DNase family protein
VELFDSHAHYNDEKFDEDKEELIDEIYKSGITRMVCAGYNIEASKKAIELAEKYDYIYATVRNISE